MTVYRLEPYKKTKVKVYFDEDAPAFVLYRKEIEKYDIKEGEDLSGETYKEILDEILVKRAVSRTLYLLDASAKTESQIRRKLRENFYPQEAIDEAVRYAKEKHYIDDEYFAEVFAERRSVSRSKRMVRMELVQKGIDRETADRVLSSSDIDEKETIRKLIIKKFPPGTAPDMTECAKLTRSLCQKGFSFDDVKDVMDSLGKTGTLDIT